MERDIRMQSADKQYSLTVTLWPKDNRVGDAYASILSYEAETETKPYAITIGYIERDALLELRDALNEFLAEPAPVEPTYMQDAPPITDADDPMNAEYPHELTHQDIVAADHSAFERGYAAAVDEFRHGLWADEVEQGGWGRPESAGIVPDDGEPNLRERGYSE